MRFHLDENVDHRVARALQRHGVDVTTAVSANLRTASDKEHLSFAKEENRVIVTHDDDFLRLASQTNDHNGIVYCHKTKYTVGDLVRRLILVFEVLNPEEMMGHVEYL
jgi:predicted nuclease of predicted toxin-antitoxin system